MTVECPQARLSFEVLCSTVTVLCKFFYMYSNTVTSSTCMLRYITHSPTNKQNKTSYDTHFCMMCLLTWAKLSLAWVHNSKSSGDCP